MMSMMAAAGSSARASYSMPKAAKSAATASKAPRQKGGTDHALKAAAAVYHSLDAADAALDARMRAATDEAENDRLEREGDRICLRRRCVVQKAIRLEAVTPAGTMAKAAMLDAEIRAAKGMELSTENSVLKLAASLAADVRRTAAPTLAGVLVAEDAGLDAELIEACAAWPAVTAAYLAEQEDGGPANRAMDALAARVSSMKPRTVAGMLAKARVAKAEAIDLHGHESPSHTYAETVAWDLLNDLLRLTGEGA